MEEIKKYELIQEDTTKLFGKTLYRIKALIAFGTVEVGEIGGYIESENNLSHNANAWVSGNARVTGNAWVSGNAQVSGDAQVSGNAQVYGHDDYICISPIGSENGVFTAYKTESSIECNRGCFHGTIDEFAEKVKQTHGENGYAQEYAIVIDLVKKRLGITTKEE